MDGTGRGSEMKTDYQYVIEG